jgi:predicted AlkP superfamily phosphohydrolase/phosphomutase
MISGMIVPSHLKIFTYPPSLHTELIRELGDYPIDIWLQKYVQKKDPIEGLKALYYYTSFRQKASLYLLENKGPFDFFMVVFRGTDFVQHYAFKFLDEDYIKRHPEEGEKYGEVIYQFYERMDVYIAQLMQKMGKDCTVIIMSDHGGGPLKKYFYINSWLIKEGYLKLKKEAKKRQIKVRRRPLERVFKRLHLEHLLPASLSKKKIPRISIFTRRFFTLKLDLSHKLDQHRTRKYKK